MIGLEDPIDGNTSDDAPPGSFCYGTGLVRVCFSEEPMGDPQLTTQQLNTDTPLLCSDKVVSGGTGYCVIGAHSITVPSGSTVTTTGSKPLVLVATDAMTIDGTLDVASHRSSFTVPAGGDSSLCNAGGSPGSIAGGAGGSFTAQGGDGGGPSPSTTGAPLAAPTMLHGGCAGRNGGGGDAGSRGHGGGAAYLIAVNSIAVAGSINASGAGGGTGEGTTSGGGGGGSGGMIGLDAPMLQISGFVFANGGGGAEGAGTTSGGQPGGDPMMGSKGAGGAGGSAGGDGGDGGAGTTAAGATGADGASGVGGGGGGGGSVGVILFYGTPSGSGVVSPPPS